MPGFSCRPLVPLLLTFGLALFAAGCRHAALAPEVPPMPTSPYAQWTRGPSTHPDYFPVGAWLQDPSTAGRVGVGFDRSKGHAENDVDTKNTTANDELVACNVKAVRTMRFDPELVAHVDEYAWVVSGR